LSLWWCIIHHVILELFVLLSFSSFLHISSLFTHFFTFCTFLHFLHISSLSAHFFTRFASIFVALFLLAHHANRSPVLVCVCVVGWALSCLGRSVVTQVFSALLLLLLFPLLEGDHERPRMPANSPNDEDNGDDSAGIGSGAAARSVNVYEDEYDEGRDDAAPLLPGGHRRIRTRQERADAQWRASRARDDGDGDGEGMLSTPVKASSLASIYS
jgi:hypothetical protein